MAHELEIIQAKIPQKYRPTVYWYSSFRCNLQCRHCSVHSSPYVDTSADLTPEEAQLAIIKLKEANAAGVIMTGGEPLYREDFPAVFRALIDAGIGVAIETNGLLIDDKFIELFQEGRAKGGKITIAISLDGGTKDTHEWMRGKGTFGRTIETFRLLKAAGIRFRVQCVVHRENLESIPGLFEIGAGLLPELDYLIFAFLHPVGRGLQMWDDKSLSSHSLRRAYDLIVAGMNSYAGKVSIKLPPAMIPPAYLTKLFHQDQACSCNTTCAFPTLGILPNGEVTVCALTRNDPSVLYGNVRSDSLVDICIKADLDHVREEYLLAHLTGVCADCVFAASCKGGCRAYAYEEFGDFSAPHPLCDALDKSGEFPLTYRASYMRKQSLVVGQSRTGSVELPTELG